MVLESLPDILPLLLDFFEQYGLVAMFILLVLDGAMLIPVLPGEAVMIMAVTQFAHSVGDLVLLVAIATAAAILGALLLYGIARVGGRPLIERHPRLFMMDRHRRESLESTFQHPFGQTLVAALRVIPLTRIVVSIPAGLAKMGVVRYTIMSAIGMLAFHSGFMWLAFKSQESGSIVSEQATALQEAYATPAWQYLQAHEAVAIVGALAIGAWISYRSSRRMLKHPRGSLVSIIGYLAVRVLVIGSLGLWAMLYYDPTLVYEAALAGGVDVQTISAAIGIEAVRWLTYFGLFWWIVGVLLWGLESAAKKRRRKAEAKHAWEKGPEGPVPDQLEEADVTELSTFSAVSDDDSS